MQIVDFTLAHVEQAGHIAMQNYEAERKFVSALPVVEKLPDLADFATNKLGVTAIDGGELVGFLCWRSPIDNLFGTSKGMWSPLHAHGAIKKGCANIYDRLYQAAAEKLMPEHVLSHGISLYEHDKDAKLSFLQNGFGSRCVDAIRSTGPIIGPVGGGLTFRQAMQDDAEVLADMSNMLGWHLSGSPMFMPFTNLTAAYDIAKDIESGDIEYFVAVENKKIVSYYCIQKDGENFASNDASVINICGAYALPETRGKGISVALLSWLMNLLRERGYLRCGVDFECFNYTARRFWLKYFTAYSDSVVRRIDERICLSNTVSYTNRG